MKQITIVESDRPGLVADITEALAAANVNIESLTAEAVGNAMVAILTVDKYDEALRALTAGGMQAFSEEVIVIQVEDRPGELARIMHRFKEANINLRSIRPIRRDGDKALVALGTERTQEAMELVRDVMVS
jgi:hypothetical protein